MCESKRCVSEGESQGCMGVSESDRVVRVSDRGLGVSECGRGE